MKSISIKVAILTIGLMTISLPVMSAGSKGMTWGWRGIDNVLPNGKHYVSVGCNSNTQWASGQTMCNAYQGETSCTEKRHILCMKNTGNIKRPPYAVTDSGGGMRKEFYAGWSPKMIKLGPRKKGTDLTSLAVANNFCGAGWRIAEFHDGFWIAGMDANNHHRNSSPQWNLNNAQRGGWNFYARFKGNNNSLNKLKTKRFWVQNNDSNANCWNP